jgi:glycerol-3-phosphate O-acyltransferase
MPVRLPHDDVSRAVLADADVARYASDPEAQARLKTYLDELRTTQRYRIYRALQHPLYPIYQKITRVTEHADLARQATAAGQVVYVSNHKSHLDYFIQLLVLEENGIRPPLIAAGINLFGGPLGLLHRHIVGSIPIRRGSKDPVYLATLKAWVAEVLKRRDVLYYAEGGRSYTGELKPPKTGLLQAALQADRAALRVVPVAIAYDLVLEDRIVTRDATRARKRPFASELGEMIRYGVGFKSRAVITFGQPIPLADYDPASRRDLVTLAHRIQGDIGRLYKVLPTALVAAAFRASPTRRELAARVDDLIAGLADQAPNLDVRTGREAVDQGLERLIERGILTMVRQRVRVRDRITLRYYARTIQHLLPSGAARPRRVVR